MDETAAHVDIPKRALFKTAEVCEILHVQPYVLRSWEAEFPELGVARTAGGPRVYRRADVERAARLKHLVIVEGLTLAGARRRLDEEGAPVAGDASGIDELLGQNARERLADVKRGLRQILDLLAGSNGGPDRVAAPARVASSARSARAGRASIRKRGTSRKRS
jgi:DNA-binding transcriptional MerR regulator